MNTIDDLPDAQFAPHGSPPPDWRSFNEEDPDDEEMETTPQSVILALGFDPKELNEATPTQDDFEEAKHPRDKDGQFAKGSGGGGGGKAAKPTKNMGSSPKGMSKKDALPALAKSMKEKSGKNPTPKEFHEAALAAGFNIIPEQSVKYLKMFTSGKHSGAGVVPPVAEKKAPEAKKLFLPPESSSKVLTKEGFAYMGSEYGALSYEAKNGAKAIYNPNIDAWAVTSANGSKEMGTGAESFNKALEKSTKPEAEQPPGNKTATAAAAAAPAPSEPKPAKDPAQMSTKEETQAMVTAAGKSASELINGAATGFGYPKEGTWNGIDYWKASNGKKISYKPDTDTWMVQNPDKTVLEKGDGIVELLKYIQHHPQEAAAVAKAGDPPFAHTQTSTAAMAPQTSTKSAKTYGANIPHEKFSFTSKGIANEKALPLPVQDAIVAYKGNSWYHKINDAMRFDAAYEDAQPKVLAYILKLERAFQQVAPSKEDAKVGRKIGMEAFKTMVKNAGVEDLNDLKPGVVLEEPGIVSTSHSPHVWGGKVKFEITVPKGSRAVDISETINKGEAEVLLPPRSKFLVKEIKKNASSGGSNFEYVMVVEYQK